MSAKEYINKDMKTAYLTIFIHKDILVSIPNRVEILVLDPKH